MKILREHNVLKRGEVGNQMKLLEDEANFFGAHTIKSRDREAGDVHSVEPYLARGWAVETSDQVYQRRLARTRRSHDRDPLAGIHAEREIIERANDASVGLSIGGIRPAHILKLDHLTLPSKSKRAEYGGAES